MRGCSGDRGGGAAGAGRPVLQSLSPINITSENEVIVAARQSGKTLSQLQEDFLFPLFNCSSVLPPSTLLPPIHVLRPPLHLGRGRLLDAALTLFLRGGRRGSCSLQKGFMGAGGDPGSCSGFCSACAVTWPWEGGGCRAAPSCLWSAPTSMSHPWERWGVTGPVALSLSSSWSLFGTVVSAQRDRQEDLYILSPRIWKSLKMEVFRVNIYPKLVLHQHLPGLQ